MLLYTIQPLSVYEELKSKGFFISDPEKSSYYNKNDDLNFIPYYNWLIKEMEERIGPRPKNVIIPIWSWYLWDDCRKPDMRKHNKNEKPYCVIQFEKNDNEVVLTDFDCWHFVINNIPFLDVYNEEEYNKLDNYAEKLKKEDIDKYEEFKKDTWKGIFNWHIDPKDIDNWVGRGHYVQATFWILNLNEVKKVKIYK